MNNNKNSKLQVRMYICESISLKNWQMFLSLYPWRTVR